MINPKKHLAFDALHQTLSACFKQMPDSRQPRKLNDSLHEVLMSGFACLYFQDPSLLPFQKRLEKKYHRNNLQTLFGVTNIPESTQLRTVIDQVDPTGFKRFFNNYTHFLQRGKQ